MKPCVWVVPERSGGIRTYSEALWKGLEPLLPEGSRILFEDDIRELAALKPSLVHVQHEYGCWGSKIPGKYRFPKWLRNARRALPNAKFVATAHSVIPLNYRYAIQGKGWQAPLRLAANTFAMPSLIRWWNDASWGKLDAVIVHSGHQLEPVRRSGCPVVREVPHFVPDAHQSPKVACGENPRILVFGYFTPDKAQDVAIRAMANLPGQVTLILAGGTRNARDEEYFRSCEKMIADLGLSSRVKITGFLQPEKMDEIYADATLVLAPFRYTTGSGSLAHALARGKPILASDLPLNREIAERVPGSLSFYLSEDPQDCAREAQRLLSDASSRDRLILGAREYAMKYSVDATVKAHLRLYEELLATR